MKSPQSPHSSSLWVFALSLRVLSELSSSAPISHLGTTLFSMVLVLLTLGSSQCTIRSDTIFETHAVMSQNSTSHTPVSVGPPVAADNAQTIDHDVEMSADDMRSLAERRTRRMDHRLPARYRDVLPQPPPPMAAPSFPSPLAELQAPLSISSQDFTLGSRLVTSCPSVFYNTCQ